MVDTLCKWLDLINKSMHIVLDHRNIDMQVEHDYDMIIGWICVRCFESVASGVLTDVCKVCIVQHT